MSPSPSSGHADIELAAGRLFIAWKEFDGDKSRVRLAESDDSGASWNERRTIAETTGASDHPFLLRRGADVFLSWHTEREGLRIEPVVYASAAAKKDRADAKDAQANPADAPAQPSAFGLNDLRAIEERHHGRPFLAVLWSLDCAPCRSELELLGELRRTHPELDLVLISTDPGSTEAATLEILSSHGLAAVESWAFADANAERLRFSIDPEWFGELPRAYFYDGNGSRRGVSGALSQETVVDWLRASGAP
jgi:hypothetical protein